MQPMMIPISIQNPPQRFKVGDYVTITNPEFVLRVGYPMSFEDAYKHVEEKHLSDIEDFIDEKILGMGPRSELMRAMLCSPTNDKNFRKILRGLAGIYLDAKGHGGKERSIHKISKQEMQGKTFEIISKRVVKTGTYYPPWSQQDYQGEWDGGPGGLDNCKTHVILELNDHTLHWNFQNKWDGCWIESCNVRKSNAI